MSVVTFTLSIAGADFGTLAKVYALIADPKIRANVAGGGGAAAPAAAAQLEAPVKRKPGRPPGSGKKAQPVEAAPGAPVVEKRKPGRPRKNPDAAPAAADLEEKFSRWHAGQKGANGRGKFFTGAEIKVLLPAWEAALAQYQRAAGSQVADLRSVKSWSIARLRRETEALGGSADQEDSPVSEPAVRKTRGKAKGKSKGKAKSRFTALAAAQQANKKPRGRPRKNAEPSPS